MHWLTHKACFMNEESNHKSYEQITVFYYKFCPNLLSGGIHKNRVPAKQSLLRWPCPLPSDRAILVLWQNLESNVKRTHIAAHGRSPH